MVHLVSVVEQTTVPVAVSAMVYPAMSAPPLAGAVHVSVIDATPKVAMIPLTFEGTVAGTALSDVPASPSPIAVRATTSKVYSVPLVSKVTTQVVSPVVVQVRPPGLAVTR